MINRTQKLCHLCGVLYWDDPLMVETPGHTSEKCLATLRYTVHQLELHLRVAYDNLRRAENEYQSAEGEPPKKSQEEKDGESYAHEVGLQ